MGLLARLPIWAYVIVGLLLLAYLYKYWKKRKAANAPGGTITFGPLEIHSNRDNPVNGK